MHTAEAPRGHPTPNQLARIERFQSLRPTEREALARHLSTRTAAPGTCLLERGSQSTNILYLLDGQVELEARDGQRHLISAGEAAARQPISHLRPSLYRVTARTMARYLDVENHLLERLVAMVTARPLPQVDDYLVVEAGSHEIANDFEGMVINRIMDDLRHGRLMLPSPAGIGEKAGRAVLAAGQDEKALVDSLMQDPVLSAKIIQSANRHHGQEGVETVAHAVHLLGPTNVAELTVRCLLTETLRSRNRAIHVEMQRWWRHSLSVSAISRRLATLCEAFDPELAATTGLLHRIGVPALLGYASSLRQGKDIDAGTLQELLRTHARDITELIAVMGSFGPITKIALSESSTPLHGYPEAADYGDILTVADRYAQQRDGEEPEEPPPDVLPVLHRLGLERFSPEMHREMAANEARGNLRSMTGS